MTRVICGLVGAAAMMMAGGCSTYIGNYQYEPHQAVVAIAPASAQQPPPATVMASVVGVRRGDYGAGIPFSIEVRVRVDNNSAQAVTLDPRTLNLTDGQLLNFPPPLAVPPQPVTLEANQSTSMILYFPFPPGLSETNTDMSMLQLRWVLNVGDHPMGQGIVFHRVMPVYYEEYPYGYAAPYPVEVGGAVIVHGR